jgi:hemerythrin
MEGKQMTVMWQDEMSVGNVKVDNDHKYLISIINTIEAGMDCDVSCEALSAYVSQLFDYSYKHFQREEKYQAEIDYPERNGHKKEHADLMEQIKQIHDDFQNSAYDTDSSGACELKTPHLVHFLREWLMTHFSNEDVKMKKYFTASKLKAVKS